MALNIERNKYVIKASVNRPDALNAVNFELMDRLEQLLDELENNREVRLFILTGTGSSFISGGDLREFHQLKKADEAKRMTSRVINILKRIEQLPFWTLAAINGYAYGGGWEIASYFDFRVVSRDAKIGFTQGKFYLPPGWGGVSVLSKLVPKSRALYWLASQKVITAEEAVESGFADELFESESFDESLEKLSSKLTLNDRTFIEYLKRSPEMKDASEEIEPFSRFWESEEHQKRVDAFLKRKS
ncbi:enoyl-CoA hydratase/isomerase family protein [Rhodohalobacter sp. SW132]|uniref:enoyl-CoA hydratase/isomerase family protein n=1 Tax=Rhodohalobacter sp. SW132 TaxID=2293433 RepID=UPI000E28782A|nr:enoyl-CoA hydratase/isomerase family protein [Rhodohalobacter sp. SW132]REL39248.1 enoyl-CoA hydratase/isomerase family protein [Rhodohalobacter sp. SW132]